MNIEKILRMVSRNYFVTAIIGIGLIGLGYRFLAPKNPALEAIDHVVAEEKSLSAREHHQQDELNALLDPFKLQFSNNSGYIISYLRKHPVSKNETWVHAVIQTQGGPATLLFILGKSSGTSSKKIHAEDNGYFSVACPLPMRNGYYVIVATTKSALDQTDDLLQNSVTQIP